MKRFTMLLQRRFDNRAPANPGPSIPQIIGRLLDLFPAGEHGPVRRITANKWASTLPDEVNEVLASHGGLAKFASANPNFFSIYRENGTVTMSLSDLGLSLVRQKRFKEEQRLLKDSERGFRSR